MNCTPLSLVLVVLLCGCLQSCHAANPPQQIHMSLTGHYRTIFLNWITFSESYSPVVYYGSSPSNLTYQAGTYNVYHYEKVTGWPGWVISSNFKISSDMGPEGSTVYYKVGDTISGDYSSLLSFTIPRETMNQFRPFTFAIFGDMDINSDSSDTVTLMEKTIDEYDLFIHMGDIAYTSLSTHIAVNASRLDDFFTYIQPIASQVPYLVSPGNQEMYYRFYEYENRWSTPVKTGQNKNLWYSFDFAGVHFVSISTEHDMDPSSEQYAWLESDLSTANSAAARATSPWIFVYGHRPIYCSNTPLNAGYFEDCYVVGVALRENLEPLLRKYNVDMYFSGHMHDAEVTYPLKNGKVLQRNWANPPANSITQVISGNAGCREGFNVFDPMFTQPFTAFRQDSHYGFARVTVYNATHTHVEFLYSDDGKSHFDFWFTKTGSGDEDGADEIEENQEGGEAVWGVDEVEWCELNGNEEVVDGWMCLGGARVPSQQPGDRPRLSVTELNRIKNVPQGEFDFGVGIFIGIGDIYGNVHTDLANWEGTVSYDIFWAKELWNRYDADPTDENRKDAVEMTILLKSDLLTIVKDSGTPEALHDIGVLINIFELNGEKALEEILLARAAFHARRLRKLRDDAETLMGYKEYRQAGVEYGRIVGILMKPLPV